MSDGTRDGAGDGRDSREGPTREALLAWARARLWVRTDYELVVFCRACGERTAGQVTALGAGFVCRACGRRVEAAPF